VAEGDSMSPTARRRLVHRQIAMVALVALVLGLGVTACGDSGDADDGAGSTAAAPQGTSADGDSGRGDGGRKAAPGGATLSGDAEEARAGAASVVDVYDDFAKAVAEGVAVGDMLEAADGSTSLARVCELMSERSKRQTTEYAKRSAGLSGVDWTCEKATALVLRRARRNRMLKRSLNPKLVGVNADGDRATATVRFGRKGRVATIPLVKEDGKWKLGASPSGSESSK
jgi:hypothetical protein